MMGEKEKMLEMFNDRTLLATYRGSVSHNTFIPPDQPNSSDDVDLMGVYFAPVLEYLGLGKIKEVQESFIGQYDVVHYEFKKMISMLLKSNPNVMPILWLHKDHYLKTNIYGKALLNNRDLFSSKRAYNAYVGYAHGQLARVNKLKFEGYMGAKRKRLVDKVGYDSKMASHSIRLLRMGYEFLDTGELTVYRTKDFQELIDIKNGKWTLDEVKSESDMLFEKTKEIYQKCDLPEKPETEKVEKLVEEIMYDYITSNYKE